MAATDPNPGKPDPAVTISRDGPRTGLSRIKLEFGLFVLACLIYVIADTIWDLPPTALIFHDEIVRAIPQGDRIRFIGIYDFQTSRVGWRRQRSYELAYPTQYGRDLPPPTGVVVMADQESIPFEVLPDGLRFRLPIHPVAATRVQIEYTMAAPNHRATYITRTANLWPQPIREARFELSGGARSNYHAADTTETLFRDFRPREDWMIEWR
jgi:hypothetical protein